jgi:hypothetical protein
MNGRDLQVRTRIRCGKSWRQSGINTLKSNTLLYHYGRSRMRKLNNSTDPEDMLVLPPMDVSEIMLLTMMIISPTAHGRHMTSMMMTCQDVT